VITLNVSKLKKLNDVKLEHLENIEAILVTFDVSKQDKFKNINFVHPENIDDIS